MKKEVVWSSRKHFMWFPWTFTKYSITEDKLLIQDGIFVTRYEEIFLFRLLDCKCSISIFQRIFKTGTIIVYSYDYTSPILKIENVKNPLEIKERISSLIYANQRRNQYIEIGNNNL